MRLELVDYHLEDIQWGEHTLLSGGTLFLNAADVQNEIKDLVRNVGVRLELARPGESKRIIHVLDTIHPLEKIDSAGHTFPGIDQPAGLVGTGRTARLRNMLITITGLFPHQELMSPLEKPREGIIDMSGAGALYFLSDRSGGWNLYRAEAGKAVPLYPLEAEFGRPPWAFRASSYAFASPQLLYCSYQKNGLSELAALDRFGASAPGGEVLERLGFNVANVVARATALLERVS